MSAEKRETLLGCLLLILVSIMYFFANLQKVVVPGSVFNELQGLFNCDAASITGLGAGFMYAYSINQLTVGILADRYSGARVIAVGGAIFCLGSVLSAFAPSAEILLLSRILTGFGASSVYLSMLKLFGYTRCMLVTGIATLLCYILFVINVFVSKLPPVDRQVKLKLSTFKPILSRKHNLHLYFTTGVSFGVFYSMQMTIGKKYMEDFTGVSSDLAGIIMSVTMIISSCNAFFLAILSKLAGNRRLPFMRFCGFGCLTGGLMLLSAVLFDITAWPFSAAAWILFSFAGNCATIQVAMQKETNPANQVGTSLSAGNCFSYLIIAIVGSLTGTLLDLFPPQIVDGVKIYSKNSYIPVFILLTALGAVSATNSLFLKETYGKNIKVD